MRHQTFFFVAVCAICFLFYRCTTPTSDNTGVNDSSSTSQNLYAGYSSQVDWGQHLVSVCGCGDCHTPKKMTAQGPIDDSTLLLSGHPSQIPAPSLMPAQLAQGMAATNDLTGWIGPWGTSFAANITPDSTGIGSWTAQQFITCIRQKLFKGIVGSRPLMPPMPESFKNLTDDELNAVFSYLKSVKPIHNVVSEYQPPAVAHK